MYHLKNFWIHYTQGRFLSRLIKIQTWVAKKQMKQLLTALSPPPQLVTPAGATLGTVKNIFYFSATKVQCIYAQNIPILITLNPRPLRMILTKFGQNPTMRFQEEDENIKKLRGHRIKTDGNSSPWTFGSGELKMSKYSPVSTWLPWQH